jgi:hypothetical protein
MEYEFFFKNTMHYKIWKLWVCSLIPCIRTKGACKNSQMKLEQIQYVEFNVKSIYIDQEGD